LTLIFELDNLWGMWGEPIGGATFVRVLVFIMRVPGHLNGSAAAAPEGEAAVIPAASITKQRRRNIILGSKRLSQASTIDHRIDKKGDSHKGNPKVEDKEGDKDSSDCAKCL
jgi:hypothetical protein